MKISIVIPTYNQAGYLEETLRSVLDQKYPELELIVCDGASTDGTRDVLDRYSPQLAWWCSEKDRGQTDAINKGLRRITGEVWSYLNSDDLLATGSLARVAQAFADPDVVWVGGVSTMFDEKGERGRIEPVPPQRMRDYLTPWNRPMKYLFPCSNVCFLRRSLLNAHGTFDEALHYGMDMEYYTRLAFAGCTLIRIPEVLGHWRWHEQSKTMTDGVAYRFLQDEVRIAEHFIDRLPEDERREVAAELVQMRKHLAVRRAMHSGKDGKFGRLVREATANPALVAFRPWLGAVRETLFQKA